METDGLKRTETVDTRDIPAAGMTCENCAHRVEKALRKVDGVKDVRVNAQTESATVTFDPAKADLSTLREAIVKSGYSVKPDV